MNTPDNLFMMAGNTCTTLFYGTVVQHVYDQQGRNGSPCWSYSKMHILFLLLMEEGIQDNKWNRLVNRNNNQTELVCTKLNIVCSEWYALPSVFNVPHSPLWTSVATGGTVVDPKVDEK